jgi:hypothetical protein
MAPRALLALFLVTSLAAGCVEPDADLVGAGGDSGSGDAPDSIPSGDAPAGDNAGTSSAHGVAERTETGITVEKQGTNSYVARKTVTLRNDFGGASAADVTLTTAVGGIDADDWSDGGYRVVVHLATNGQTEQEARARMAQMKVAHTDTLSSGRLTLKTAVTGPGGGGIDADLPPEPSYRLTMSADTGGVSTSGLGGSVLTLDADTGGIQAFGSFNTVTLTTDTGGIEVEGVINSLRATVGTGGFSGAIEASATGTYTIDVDTGGIDLTLAGGSQHGYDVTADADTGGVSLDLPGSTAVGTQSSSHKHERTDGFTSKGIQTTVSASTGTGGVDVEA